jgi:hypothetical protein
MSTMRLLLPDVNATDPASDYAIVANDRLLRSS